MRTRSNTQREKPNVSAQFGFYSHGVSNISTQWRHYVFVNAGMHHCDVSFLKCKRSKLDRLARALAFERFYGEYYRFNFDISGKKFLGRISIETRE